MNIEYYEAKRYIFERVNRVLKNMKKGISLYGKTEDISRYIYHSSVHQATEILAIYYIHTDMKSSEYNFMLNVIYRVFEKYHP